MRQALQRTSSSTLMSTGSSPATDGMSGPPGTVHGRSLNLCTFRHLFSKSPSATTRCPLRTGEDGVVMGRSGSHTTDVNGAKKRTSGTGVNASSPGIGARGKAALPDSSSKDVASSSRSSLRGRSRRRRHACDWLRARLGRCRDVGRSRGDHINIGPHREGRPRGGRLLIWPIEATIFRYSSSLKARSVSVLTLSSAAVLRDSLAAVASFGTSEIATASYCSVTR